MRIIVAPAKKMVVDTDSFAVDNPPQFLERTERLKEALQGMSPKELQDLWKWGCKKSPQTMVGVRKTVIKNEWQLSNRIG